MVIAHRDTDNCSCNGECILILSPGRFDCPKCGKLMNLYTHPDLPTEAVEGVGFTVTKEDLRVCHPCERFWIIDRVTR